MLARQSTFRLRDGVEFRTPLLIPSFSSKGFATTAKIVAFMSEFITGPVLVSAYDISHKNIASRNLRFAPCIFLDSGGYEARVEHDLSEVYGREHTPRSWSRAQHDAVLKSWPTSLPTVAVTFDTPRAPLRLKDQLRKGREMKQRFPNVVVELLVKPEGRDDSLAPIDKLTKQPALLQGFEVVGFTEKELGSSVLDRVQRLARLRHALDAANLQLPIHVFGSLDTVCTPLYFLAGAEIFDGLTWLRFGLTPAQVLYAETYHLDQDNGFRRGREDLGTNMWKSNYYALQKMRERMSRFAKEGKYSVFGSHGDLYKEISDIVEDDLRGR